MLPLEWIYLQFENDQPIPEVSLSSLLEDSLAQQVLLTLNFLITQGIVSRSIIRGHSSFVLQDRNALGELLLEFCDNRGESRPAP